MALVKSALYACSLLIPFVAAAQMEILPDGDTCRNPRVPFVKPAEGEGAGASRALRFISYRFSYKLPPALSFPRGGSASLFLRDTPRREEKTILALKQGDSELRVFVGKAFDGRLPALAFHQGGKIIASVKLDAPIGMDWKPCKLSWSGGKAFLEIGAAKSEPMTLDAKFSPEALVVQASCVDELKLEGDGALSLDWESGYAAKARPGRGEGADFRLLGFDCAFVSESPTSRDFPMIAVANCNAAPLSVEMKFSMSSEIGGKSQAWTQKLDVPAKTALTAPLKFPQRLSSDVYHLKASCGSFVEERHFAFAARRDEPSGAPKFGFHESGTTDVFGYWPDCLPVRFVHRYIYWGYVMGPAWTKDDGVNWGFGPRTPAAEWSWPRGLDAILDSGLTPYVSFQAEPFLDWQRSAAFPESDPRMKKCVWGLRGGSPKIEEYRKFTEAFVERYGAKVKFFEVENEPNCHGGVFPDEDYVAVAKALYDATRKIDGARVYGICGTGDFVPWMEKVCKAGVLKYLDGVSFHTYTTPKEPDVVVTEKIKGAKELIERYGGKPLPLYNSETGVYTALRESVDKPMSQERLDELIREKCPSIVRDGWPNYALNERTGSSFMVRDLVYNFLQGVEVFTFFGLGSHWPTKDWFTKDGGDSSCFSIVSATKDGVRTPSLYTLAIGVCVEQMDGVEVAKGGKAIKVDELRGGVFQKANGGEVAIAWSLKGRAQACFKAPLDAKLEAFDLFGQPLPLQRSELRGSQLCSFEASPLPAYLHSGKPGIVFEQSPFGTLRLVERKGDAYLLKMTVRDIRGSGVFKGALKLAGPEGSRFEPAGSEFSVEALESKELSFEFTPPEGFKAKVCEVEAKIALDGAGACVVSAPIALQPAFKVESAPESLDASSLPALELPGEWLLMDSVDQVKIGAPPKMASLQEEAFWKGPEELSAKVKYAANGKGLFAQVIVKDASMKVPSKWPGVSGSCIEFFFDFRRPARRAEYPKFEKGVYQAIISPALTEGDATKVWNASERHGVIEGLKAVSVRLGPKSYAVNVFVPWDSIGGRPKHSIALDVSADAPGKGEPQRRKCQMALFGDESNNLDPSNYGVGLLR